MRKILFVVCAVVLLFPACIPASIAGNKYYYNAYTNITPALNSTFFIGSPTLWWDSAYIEHLYTANGTIGASNVTTPGGTTDYVAKFNTSTNIVNSDIKDNATSVYVLDKLNLQGDLYTDRWLNHDSNTFVGVDVAGGDGLRHVGGVEGQGNTALGYKSLYSINTSYYNTAIGYFALTNLTNGLYNTAVGQGALADVTTGQFNTAVGLQALNKNTGNYNTAVGLMAGHTNVVGDNNIFIGAQAGKNELGSNKLYIDSSDTATPLIGGDFNTNIAVINGALDMATHQINNVVNPTLNQDAATKLYVDTAVGIAGTGNVTASGTAGYVPIFTTSTNLTNSIMTGNTTAIKVGGKLQVDGGVTLTGTGNITMQTGMTVDGVDVSAIVSATNVTRSATLKVAANNASALEKSQSDYVCDATSDEVQINAAIDALVATGGSVELSSGTFKINAQIDLHTNTTLRGQGDSTIITTNVNAINLIRGDGGSGTELTGITVEKLVLNGTAGGFVAVDLLYFDYVDYSTVQNCRFLNSGTANKAGAWFSYCDNIKVLGNTANSNLGNGLLFSNCTNNTVSNNICLSNSYHGIYFNTCSYCVASSNVCSSNTLSGINLVTATYCIVSNNVCNSNLGVFTLGGGISVITTSTDIVISGNSCYNNTGNGIVVATSSNYVTVSNNDCRNNYCNIFLYNSVSKVNVSGNVCKGATNGTYGSGIFIHSSTDCNVMGNLCGENVMYGIVVGTGSSRNNVSANVIYNNTLAGIASTDAAYCAFANNVLYNNTYGMTFNGTMYYCSIVGNTIVGNKYHGIIIQLQCNSNLISNNSFDGNSQQTTNTYDNLYVSNCEYNSIQGNTFRSIGGAKVPRYAINISDSTALKNIVEQNDLYDDGYGTAIWNDVGTLTLKRQNRGDTPVQQAIFIRVKNTSSANMTAGDVVTFKAVAAGNEVTLTVTQGDNLVFGMMAENTTINSWGMCQIEGYTTALKADGTTDIAIGDLLGTFTTAGIVMKASAGDMVIAIALEAYTSDDSNGIINALIIKPRKL